MSVRQAHPGELRGGFANYREKLESAREYARLEGIPWRVLVDDYDGTTHLAYSRAMADPTFLIDADGRVAFYNMWTHAPTLKRALDELLARDGRGVVAGGIDRTPHVLASSSPATADPAGADGAAFSSTTSAASAPAACPFSAVS